MKKVTFLLLIIVLIGTTLPLFGCANRTHNVATELSLKYGDTFTVHETHTDISSRFVRSYVTSNKYSDVTFDVWIDKSTEEITDDYVEMIVADKLQQKFTENLSKSGIESFSKITFSLTNREKIIFTDTEADIHSYLRERGVDKIIVHSSIKKNNLDTQTAEKIIQAAFLVSQEYNAEVLFSGYLLTNDFKTCVHEMKTVPKINEIWYNNFNVSKYFYFSVKNGISSKTASELQWSQSSESIFK